MKYILIACKYNTQRCTQSNSGLNFSSTKPKQVHGNRLDNLDGTFKTNYDIAQNITGLTGRVSLHDIWTLCIICVHAANKHTLACPDRPTSH